MKLHLHVGFHLNEGQLAFINESAMCGDDQLAEGKAEVHAFTFVAKNASKILLRSEILIPASSTWTMTSSFEDGAGQRAFG